MMDFPQLQLADRLKARLRNPNFCLKIALSTYRYWISGDYEPPYDFRKAPPYKEHREFEELVLNSAEAFIHFLSPYVSEIRWFVGQVYIDAFMSIDPEPYHSFIRRHQQNLIVEIGCGHSTLLARDAIRSNSHGNITCVHPHPNAALPSEIDHIPARVKDHPLDFFASLNMNDILFIDASQKTSEAQYHCQKILPSLKGGVLIDHHDFTFPFQIYHNACADTYGEPDVLLSFYNTHRSEYEILICASYVAFSKPDVVRSLSVPTG